MAMSTPGGTEIGVRPSLDGLLAVTEKGRLGVDCSAGTRKMGKVKPLEHPMAFARALPSPGRNMVAEVAGPAEFFWTAVQMQAQKLDFEAKKSSRDVAPLSCCRAFPGHQPRHSFPEKRVKGRSHLG